MKFLVLTVALAMFVSVQALTDEQKEKLKEHHKVCAPESGVDAELIKKMRGGDFDIKDDKFNDYLFCMFKRSGIMDDQGKLLKDVALAKVEPEIRDAVEKAIDACIDKSGATPAETAFEYARCYHKERPDHATV